MSERLDKLLALLAREPKDPFLLYGIAMEYKKAGELDRAVDFLNKTIVADSNYCYAYFQLGQVNESLGKIPEAKKAYRDGMEAAQRAGDSHAKDEIAGALNMIE